MLINQPVFIPLLSIEDGATSVLTTVAESSFNRGIVRALQSPGARVERLNDTLAR
ncbi:hypothetical protein [Paraburkholderia sp. J76]|uniref:hypothetical protein n=1 Tax=Paraburkholderia sp. J76 TaxID=2805439 RepID=UPI002ABD3029|nr:hypothetical protein [Paraburkholderia sp. J76]